MAQNQRTNHCILEISLHNRFPAKLHVKGLSHWLMPLEYSYDSIGKSLQTELESFDQEWVKIAIMLQLAGHSTSFYISTLSLYYAFVTVFQVQETRHNHPFSNTNLCHRPLARAQKGPIYILLSLIFPTKHTVPHYRIQL